MMTLLEKGNRLRVLNIVLITLPQAHPSRGRVFGYIPGVAPGVDPEFC